MCQIFLPYQDCVVSRCICMPHFLYPFIYWWTFRLLLPLAIVTSTAMNIDVQISIQVPAFTSFGYVPRSGISRSYSNSVFNFSRNCRTVFYSSCTILCSHQQCTKALISPHPCQYLLFSGFFGRSHQSRCEVVSHCRFLFVFPLSLVMLSAYIIL